jgi:hypothetical protein
VTTRLAFARNRGVRQTQNAREGPPLEPLRARRKRCAEAQVRGGDSPAERRREPSLGSARSRRIPCFFGSMTLRGSSAHAVFLVRGGAEGEGGKKVVTSSAARGVDAARGWCPYVVELQKSEGRPRAQRSAPSR